MKTLGILTAIFTGLTAIFSIYIAIYLKTSALDPKYCVVHGYDYQARQPIMISADNRGRVVVRPEFINQPPVEEEKPKNRRKGK